MNDNYKWIDNNRWRHNAVAITPYTSIYENVISFGDVGKTITLDEYLKIENAYIESVKIIMHLNKCDWLKIRYTIVGYKFRKIINLNH
jgi:hypothetical protein